VVFVTLSSVSTHRTDHTGWAHNLRNYGVQITEGRGHFHPGKRLRKHNLHSLVEEQILEGRQERTLRIRELRDMPASTGQLQLETTQFYFFARVSLSCNSNRPLLNKLESRVDIQGLPGPNLLHSETVLLERRLLLDNIWKNLTRSM